MKELTEEQMNEMSLDELQLIIETMNVGKRIDNDQFKSFQISYMNKEANITKGVN